MPFPPHIESVLDRYGVSSATKAQLFDLYISMGEGALDVFIELAESLGGPARVEPEDLVHVRLRAAANYLRRNHQEWLEGKMTPSFWYPRPLEGRASGMFRPLGRVGDESLPLMASLPAAVRAAAGDDQPVPEGMVLLGKNAHYGGRLETITFDIVPSDVEDAIAIAQAAGQQHTAPGSIGATSGTTDLPTNQALVWEIQPNVLKPREGRNQSINRLWRKHRNWHIATLTVALGWLVEQSIDVYILRGSALATTHEVNPNKPVVEEIEQFHDRTVRAVAEAFGGRLVTVTAAEVERMQDAELMNHALSQWVRETGGTSAFWRYVAPVSS
jgi:hypothetical protein